MPTSGRIGSRGRLTIPIEIRRDRKLNAGDCVEFCIDGKQAGIRHAQANPFEKYVGCLPGFQSQVEINAWTSRLRDKE